MSVVDYKDADCLVEIYSQDLGKNLFLAKGMRRLKSRKRGNLEVFSQVRFSWLHTKGLPLVTEAQVITPFPKIKEKLTRVSLAFYFCEIIKKLTKEEDPNLELYEILGNFFARLESAKRLKELKKEFLHNTLVALGYLNLNTKITNYDLEVEKITEKKINSLRVGKNLFS